MAMKNRQFERIRICLAQEAARIIQNEGVKDYQLAKRKAADRMNVSQRSQLPSNSEIESALRDHQHIFFSGETGALHNRYLLIAREAMRMLDDFSPRLVGPVLEGTANSHSSVNLHVFTDSSEEILILLMDAAIPYETGERRYRYKRDYKYYPCVQFVADGVEIDLAIFPLVGLRQPPLSTVDGKPMRRADLVRVGDMLAATTV